MLIFELYFSSCGMLVIRNPPCGTGAQVPEVLGMNVLSWCYQELFGWHGPTVFDAPSVSGASKSVFEVLQHCCQVSPPSLLFSQYPLAGS